MDINTIQAVDVANCLEEAESTKPTHRCPGCCTMYHTVAQMQCCMIKHHKEEFKCQYCLETFSVAGDNKNHEKICGAKGYGCEICQKRFNTLHGLDAHCRQSHKETADATVVAISAMLPRSNTSRMSIVLGADPKGKNFLYTNGTNVIIRNIDRPFDADIYKQHACLTNVAKYSPDGLYIASGDVLGNIRVWDTVNKDHPLKNSFQPLSGGVTDLIWSGDSTQICAVGTGTEITGCVFNVNTSGKSEVDSFSKSISLKTVDMRQSEPFTIITVSEDNTLAFYEGHPFKIKFTINRSVNCVRYSPDGETFITGGVDGKSFIWHGKTGMLYSELGSSAHDNAVYGVCFNADSTQVLTTSADKTAKIWDVANATVLTVFCLGTAPGDIQVGCLWQNDNIMTVSLSGSINYLDVNKPKTALKVIKGHTLPITALAVSDDGTIIYTAGVDGLICYWNEHDGCNGMFEGEGHKGPVQDLVVNDGIIYSCAKDFSLIASSMKEKRYGSPVQLRLQPQKMAVTHCGLQIVTYVDEIVGIHESQEVFNIPAAFKPSCVAINSQQNQVAFGGKDNKIHIYSLFGKTMMETRVLDDMTPLTDVKYSPDGYFLCASNEGGIIHLYKLPEYSISSEWQLHTNQVTNITWAPNSKYFVSGSLDTTFICFEPSEPERYAIHKGSHEIIHLKFLNENSIISVGQDGNVKLWNLKHAEK